jgi:3-oxoacyl-[acyl-carrier protein] reductase
MPKTAIVTGASRGIGKAVAKRLARDGFAVVVNYASNAKEADATVAEIKSDGGQAIAVKADVGSAADVEQMFDETVKAFRDRRRGGQQLRNHVALADWEGRCRAVRQSDPDQFARHVPGDGSGGAAHGGRRADHCLFQQRAGEVVSDLRPLYRSKAGVEGLVHVLANEMRGRNITVNAVAPGPVGTELFLSGKSEEQIAEMAKLAPLERLGEPEDIARVVSFLAGPEGGWINSQVLRVNGGFAY